MCTNTFSTWKQLYFNLNKETKNTNLLEIDIYIEDFPFKLVLVFYFAYIFQIYWT